MRVERPGRQQVLPNVTNQPQLNLPLQQSPDVVSELTEVATEAFKTYQAFETREAQAEGIEAANKYNAWKQEAMWDPKSGYLSLSGKEAVKSAQDMLQKSQEKWESIAAELGAEAQKYFYKHTVNDVQRFEENVNQHAQNQVEVWNNNETDLYLQDSVSKAYHYEGKDAAKFIDSALAQYETMLVQNGVPTQEIKERKAELQSNLIRSLVIGHLARDDLEKAMAIYEANSDLLLANDAVQVSQEIEQARERQEEQAEAQLVLTSAREMVLSGLSLGQIADKAYEKFEDATVAERVVQQAQVVMSRQEQYRKADEVENGSKVIELVQGNPAIQSDMVSEIYPHLWESLTPEQKKTFQNRLTDDGYLDGMELYLTFMSMTNEQVKNSTASWGRMVMLIPDDFRNDFVDRFTSVMRGSVHTSTETESDLGMDAAGRLERTVTDMVGAEIGKRSQLQQKKARFLNSIIRQMLNARDADGKITPEEVNEIRDAMAFSLPEKETEPLDQVFADEPFGVEDLFRKLTAGQRERIQSELEEMGVPVEPVTLLYYHRYGSEPFQVIQRSGNPVTEQLLHMYVNDTMPESAKRRAYRIIANDGDPKSRPTKQNLYAIYFFKLTHEPEDPTPEGVKSGEEVEPGEGEA